MEAYLRIYKVSGVSFVERYLIGMEDEMTSHCIGALPELFDGNPPFVGSRISRTMGNVCGD